jgi:predicted TPR repeat methyltransferase
LTIGAKSSLSKTAELDPSISAAKHMLKALDEGTATTTSSIDSQYVRDLFSDYALSYDSHTKKMLYSAPRVIRQELSTIYKARYTTRGANGELIVDRKKIQTLKDATVSASSSSSSTNSQVKDEVMITRMDEDECDNPFKSNEVTDFIAANTTVASSCSTYTSFMDSSLDVLDLGCGTGQTGAWVKDYARTMVGVDLSSAMLSEARRKGLYQELYEMSIAKYVDSVVSKEENGCSFSSFDVIVAAEVFSYIGDLADTIRKV